ncbi:MAG: diguanylate cyclase, partial [Gammaproteobacteria bacterium]
MSPDDEAASEDQQEMSVLISALRATDQRLQELTGGEIDTVVDRDGQSFLLRRAQEKLRYSDAAKQAAILNALPAHIALVDSRGFIASVNDAWRQFADENGFGADNHGIALNYLAVCDRAFGDQSAIALAVAAGIRSVLSGKSRQFCLEYPCHSPLTRRWFLLTVTPLVVDRVSGAVVMHVDVTDRRQGQERVLRFAGAMDAAADAIFLADRATMTYIHVNDAACHILGLTRDEILKRGPAAGLGVSRASLELTYDHLIASGQDAEPVEFTQPGKDGSPCWYEMRRHAQHSEYGWTIVTLVRDRTERKRAMDRIAYLNRVYAVLSGINTLIVRVRNRDELFPEACRIAVEAGGFRKAWIGLLDKATGAVVPIASANVDAELLDGIRKVLGSDEQVTRKTLTMRAIQTKATVVSNEIGRDTNIVFHRQYSEAGINSAVALPLLVAGEAVGILCLYAPEREFFHAEELALLEELAADVSFAISHIDKQARLDYLAYYDELTALANRTLFLDRLAQYTRSANRGGHQLAVFLLDIERFKNINDSLGRAAGDELLTLLAQWLVKSSGNAGLLARLGVDHFAIIMPEAKQEGDVARFVEKGLDALVSHPFHLQGGIVGVTAKVGIAMFPGDGGEADTLLRNAEAALKKAKASGDRYLFYNRRMSASVSGRLTLESQLRQALDKGEFLLHYQPKVNLKSGKLTGAEALIRWNDPRSGLVPPAKFIPVLEDTGMIYAVGRWAMRQALDDFLRWRREGRPSPRIAVNVSPLQLRDRGFIAKLAQVI